MAIEALRVLAVRAFRESLWSHHADLATIRQATQRLIHELAGRPTKLRELVDAVRRQSLPIVALSAEEIIHWREDEPRSWELVLEWLTIMDVEINVN
jgi:hypothetical protein